MTKQDWLETGKAMFTGLAVAGCVVGAAYIGYSAGLFDVKNWSPSPFSIEQVVKEHCVNYFEPPQDNWISYSDRLADALVFTHYQLKAFPDIASQIVDENSNTLLEIVDACLKSCNITPAG